MFSDFDPMVITLVVVAVAVVGSIIGVARRGRAEHAPDRTALPTGADAALWSITEVLPDPRNHLAVKDPTSELRLTARERADALAATTAPAIRPAEAARSAQSLAARRAALAKRGATASGPAAATTSDRDPGSSPTVVEAAVGTIELVQAASLDQPLTIFLDDQDGADAPRLALLPEDLASTPPAAGSDATSARWGESSARAS